MNKSTLIAVGVAAVLLVLVVATREEKVSVGIRKLDLPTVDKDKVTAVEITGGKTATVTKEGESWVVSEPQKAGQKFPADEPSIKSMLDAVPEIKASDFVTDKADKHAELEVDDAKGLRVKIMTGSSVALDVIFGKYAKQGGNYIRRPGDNSVFVTKARMAAVARKDASMWRKKQMVNAKADELLAMTVKPKAGKEFTFESADGKEWKLKDGTETPKGFRFDAQAAQRLSSTVANLRAQDFLDTITAEQKPLLGLDGPHDVVEAKTKDGRTLTIHVGVENDSKDVTYASNLKTNFDAIDAAGTKDEKVTPADISAAVADKTKPEDQRKALEHVTHEENFKRFDTGSWAFRTADGALSKDDLDAMVKFASQAPVRIDGDNQVYLVPSYSVQQLKKPLTDYRDLSLVAFDPEKAKKLIITAGAKKTVAEKSGTEWKITEPKQLPPDFEFESAQVTSQLATIKGTKASRLIAEALADPQTGLNKPTVTIEVFMEDGKTHTIRMGKDVTSDKGAKEVYVKGTIDGALYAMGDYQKKRFESGVELFKKPKPPPGFGMGGMGGMNGLENLPPDVRKKLEAQLRMQH